MSRLLSRRQLLLGSLAAMSLAACRRQSFDRDALRFWTIDLAPKFNDYFADLMAAWSLQDSRRPVVWNDLLWGVVERKLLAAVFARTAPDLVNLNPPFAANLASKGGLADLEPLLPAGAADLYVPAVWEACRDEAAGRIAIPWYLTVRLSLANHQILDQAGLAAPPKTWSELPGFLRRVRQTTGSYGLFMTVVPDDSAEMLETFVQMGVRLLDDERRAAFDSPAGRDAFAFWTDLYRDGLLPREVVSQGQRRAIELFQSGQLAVAATGAKSLGNLQNNAPGIAAVTRAHPPLVGADGTANVALMTLAVPRQSPHPDEALAFALFLTNAENQARFAREARVLPSSLSALAQIRAALERETPTTAAAEQVREAWLLSADTLKNARVLVPASPGIKRLQTILYTQLQRSMLGQVASDRALADAARDWNLYAASRWP